ncbi:MAG: hypothetical protein LBC20_07830 [Planctomycetaceae bacterium]|nr:hypothetical protein [Planctomycetaceae bacterium]
MRLKKYCVPLSAAILSHVMIHWKNRLQEELEFLSRFLYPTDELATHYPETLWTSFRVVTRRSGKISGIDMDDSTNRIELTKADIIKYRFDLKQFRREMCESFGLNPSTEEIVKFSRTISWGTWEPSKGISFPITLLLPGDDFRGQILERILRRKGSGEILMTPSRHEWKNGLEEMARENKVLLISLNEIVQMENDKLLPTQEWEEYMTAFCKMVEMDLPLQSQKKTSEYLLAKRGSWIFRYGNIETVVGGDLLGPAFVQFLLQHPNEEFHVEKLWFSVMGNPANSIHTEHSFAGEGTDLPDSLLGGADTVFDADAKKSYEKRLRELATERIEAEQDKNLAKLDQVDKEFEFIRKMLERDGSDKHQPKNLGDPVILLRDRIRRVINNFIDQVSNNDVIGGQFLKNSIRRGVFMKYSPSQEIGWVYS